MKSCIAACFWGESTLPRDQCQSPESPGLAWAGQKVLNPRAPGAELPVLPHLALLRAARWTSGLLPAAAASAPPDVATRCFHFSCKRKKLISSPGSKHTWHWNRCTPPGQHAALCSDFSRHRSYLVNSILVCFKSHPAHLVF